MDRITKKGIESYNEFVISLGYEYCFGEADDAMYRKLKSVEDIEEEIGIDLITLFKVLKGKIYSLHPKTKKICLIILPILYYCGKQWMIGCRSMELDDEENSCDSWDCYLKDYGKTWSLDKIDLTKEELL